jgi:hypothetical protein
MTWTNHITTRSLLRFLCVHPPFLAVLGLYIVVLVRSRWIMRLAGLDVSTTYAV